ncbi:hypothetical protein NADFUDRAFT_52059 [Nadsonia fulvescens var. elongata DSM 6958]|uniref:Zn(2)-C6 fungal-type domain-containing protein n=1 Tax=Nadsonia fulvescens var. elongata DSM 6958 TaxID=857566 RepID=A0A1E3PJ62_9ASCO|nr:hypothetical protein NADFUDRAFT_52059 [Nadsonia fulvescens var. elongata DSM 6958]
MTTRSPSSTSTSTSTATAIDTTTKPQALLSTATHTHPQTATEPAVAFVTTPSPHSTPKLIPVSTAVANPATDDEDENDDDNSFVLTAPGQSPNNSRHNGLYPSSSTPPRKRSKVSRACDQCRRKKIRCDATFDDSGINSECSSCLKSGDKCAFSRVPHKRGPIKGHRRDSAGRGSDYKLPLNALGHELGPYKSRSRSKSSPSPQPLLTPLSVPLVSPLHQPLPQNQPHQIPMGQNVAKTLGNQNMGPLSLMGHMVHPHQIHPPPPTILTGPSSLFRNNKLSESYQPSLPSISSLSFTERRSNTSASPATTTNARRGAGIINSSVPAVTITAPIPAPGQRPTTLAVHSNDKADKTDINENNHNSTNISLNNENLQTSSATMPLGQFYKVTYDMSMRRSSISSTLSSASDSSMGSLGMGSPPIMCEDAGTGYLPLSQMSNAGINKPAPTIPASISPPTPPISTIPMKPTPTATSALITSASSTAGLSKARHDKVIDTYYQVIHPILPVLPSSKLRFEAKLAACKIKILREGLIHAVGNVCNPQRLPAPNNRHYQDEDGDLDMNDSDKGPTARAQIISDLARLNAFYYGELTQRMNSSDKLLYVMTLMFLYLDCLDAVWLTQSITVIYSLSCRGKDSLLKSQGSVNLDDEQDNEENTLLRLFSLLHVLESIQVSSEIMLNTIRSPYLLIKPRLMIEQVNLAAFPTFKPSVSLQRMLTLCAQLAKLTSTSNNMVDQELTNGPLEDIRPHIEQIWDTKPLLKILFYHATLAHDLNLLQIQSPHSLNKDKLVDDIMALLYVIDSPVITRLPVVKIFLGVCEALLTTLNEFGKNDDGLRALRGGNEAREYFDIVARWFR